MAEPSHDSENSFLELYLDYTAKTECPTFFHRWSALASLSAWLSRSVSFEFGHFHLHPNMYCLLIGAAGTRKTTAIKIATKLLGKAGYKSFAAQKTRQEKYLADLAEAQEGELDILDTNLWAETASGAHEPADSFIAADEFGNFIGAGNLDFMSILGELWDYEGTYKYRLKNSNSILIHNPTVTILGGTTATEFNRVFPQEAIGQGFFSRLLIIHDEPTGIKYTIPPTPDVAIEEELLRLLREIRERLSGPMSITPEATALLHEVYHSWHDIPDSRFEHYSNRRQSHLIKLAMVVAASRCSMEIDSKDFIYANTVLTIAEHFMPKALGEFGKGKHSGTSHKVLQLLDKAHKPVAFKDMWTHVHTDLDNRNQLVDIIQNLMVAEKIQHIDGDYLAKKDALQETQSSVLDWTLLRDTERKLIVTPLHVV